jgi:hypothetical protein
MVWVDAEVSGEAGLTSGPTKTGTSRAPCGRLLSFPFDQDEHASSSQRGCSNGDDPEVSWADTSEPETQCEGVIDRAQFSRVEPSRAGAELLRVNDRYLLDKDPCFGARERDRRPKGRGSGAVRTRATARDSARAGTRLTRQAIRAIHPDRAGSAEIGRAHPDHPVVGRVGRAWPARALDSRSADEQPDGPEFWPCTGSGRALVCPHSRPGDTSEAAGGWGL